MKLYPHQEKIVQNCLQQFKVKNRNLIVMPTGSGKTVVFCSIAKTLDLRTLVVCHTRELIEQSKKTTQRMGFANLHAFTPQYLLRNEEILSEYDLIIVDECHRAASKSYRRIIDHFKKKQIMGATATPYRLDGQNLYEIFGRPIETLSLIDMIEADLLCDFEGYRFKTEVSLRGISTKDGDFIAARLAPVINVQNRNELIADKFIERFSQEKALCFCCNISHAENMASEFKNRGIPSQAVHGKLSPELRKKFINEFKTGKIKVLTNCQILTEGFDEPSITCLIMARPTLSQTLYTQMIGRGSRLHPGKSVCKVLEFTNNEYDVRNLEDLSECNETISRMKEGERLSEYKERTKKELETSNGVVIEEKIDILKKAPSFPMGTEFEIELLKSMKIEFKEPLFQFQVKKLLMDHTNG